MPSPNLDQIKELFESGEPFSLTDSQYKRKTGRSIPKNNTYLVKKSAVAKKAREYGYTLKIQERTISFEKEREK